MAGIGNHSSAPSWDVQSRDGYATNGSTNGTIHTFMMDGPDYRTAIMAQNLLTLCVPPIIITIGILGNMQCAIVLLRSALAKFSSSHYLAAISLANILYILLFLLQWITLLGYNGYHRPVICPLSFLLSNIASFLSMWLPVCFCVDRYIAISWPAEAPKLCTVLRSRVVVIVMTIFSLVVYLNTSTTVGVMYDANNIPWCRPFDLPFRRNKVIQMLDWIVIKLLPFVVIIVLMAAMCVTVSNENRGLSSVPDEPSQIRCTTFVYLSVFILLHLPAEIFTRVLKFKEASDFGWRPTPTHRCAQMTFQYLSDLGMAMNLFILVASYPLFRQYLVAYYHSCKQFRFTGGLSFSCTCHKPCAKSNMAAKANKTHEQICLEPKETTKFDIEQG